MPRQLIFELPAKVSRDRGDFFVSDANALAVRRIEDTSAWTQGKLALVGPEGSGKSHLLQVWAEAQGAMVLTPHALSDTEIGTIAQPVAVDDADRVQGEAEVALFHLHNRLASLGLPFLIVGREAPARWRAELPDLKSRLEATEVARIEPPDDALLSAVLVKLFTDRQIAVAPAVIDYLATRMERSFAGAQQLVDRLDRAAMAEGRAVTRTLARAVLDKP
ncbi:chromosomal replication initiator DnaA [Silicimonas algicola]|uniref:DnaA protein n=1 Tax=Silicimonas algicola TaxID=1826607 RepID=A0A316G4G2_9RHOB|nr:DnaA/Hda family protein [Silicimonas algicola]AZQ68567.1 chromosomal replication initiator DnaA [Silicimonas algicola]PWK55718.1 DnaA protein [Silicimonas algicola]